MTHYRASGEPESISMLDGTEKQGLTTGLQSFHLYEIDQGCRAIPVLTT